MKIGQAADLSKSELLKAPQAGTPRQAGSAGDTAIEKPLAATNVQLSDTSRGLVADGGHDGAPVRMAKVAEIRKAISEGRFHVTAHAVADRMISEAAELLETLSRKG